MNIYVITQIHEENNQLSRIKGYISSVNLSLFFPPDQIPFEYSRNEMINLLRQGNVFDVPDQSGKRIPLKMNPRKGTVDLDFVQFAHLPRF